MGLVKNIGSKRGSFLQSKFIEQATREAFANIFSEQDSIIEENGLSRNGSLDNLDKRRYRINVENEGVSGSMTIPKRMRFIDMKRLRGKRNPMNLPIYNRTVFGTIYGSLIPELRFGFTESVKQQIAQEYKIEL